MNNILITDINECNTGNGGCEHTCTNNDGSFTCACDTGYQLDSNQYCSGRQTHTHTHTYMQSHTHINIHTQTHTHIHIYTCTVTYTHTNTHA